jgi:hypothetical protein
MTAARLNLAWGTIAAFARSVLDRIRRRRRPPEPAGVREPRRPHPGLPAAAVALAEPRADQRRWIKLINLRDRDSD